MSEASEEPANGRSARARALARVRAELGVRLTPERTRRASWVERMTVSRLSWNACVRLNRYLEFFGRLATVVYFGFIVTVVFGVDWRHVVEDTINSGEPIRGAIILVVVLPTLLFVALHSMTGWGRWRLQRELWRRDVALLGAEESASGPTSHSHETRDRR